MTHKVIPQYSSKYNGTVSERLVFKFVNHTSLIDDFLKVCKEEYDREFLTNLNFEAESPEAYNNFLQSFIDECFAELREQL
tara:strand:- start:403 stop:645 length:243 start_codon:yes stop_codon:yes gene_type:complete